MFKILIIEDEQNLLDALAVRLKESGYETETAPDGAVGLEKAKTVSPDLILLDLLLPKIDGISLLREFRKDDDLKKVPVIVLTNFFNQKLYDIIIEAGASDYLVKSDYKLEDILEKIGKALNPS